MKEFMAVFIGSPTSPARQEWDRLDEQTRKQRQAAGMKAWQDWMTRHRSIIAQGGGPLSKTKRISKQGITDTRNELAAFVVVRAESHEAAARLFENHPHFALFPGDAVEVMEILPVPGG